MIPPKPELRVALASRYLLDREIGRGGMATVYLAQDIRHHRPVAVKVLHQEIAGTIGPDRFLREIEIAANLTHPNIVPLHDSGEAAGWLYYVMPFVEGRSLRELLEERGRLPVEEAIRIASGVADALEYAHAHNVVHRDIKPENILLQSGHAVVTDFGIARALRAASAERLTGEHFAIGTPPYMSPEQSTGSVSVDGRSDIYSLGCVVFEMLAGVTPFSGPIARAGVSRISFGALRRNPADRRAPPPAVERALERALAADPADRFPTAAEFARALRTPFGRWRRMLLIGGLVLAAAVSGTLALDRSRLLPSRAASALLPRRVVVAQLANRTGKPDLDYVGVMAADWITEGMLGTGVVDVVPSPTALQAARFVESERARHPAADPVRSLADETGAGIVITGSYYYAGDALQIQVEVADAQQGKLLGTVGPVESPITTPIAAIDGIRTRLMGMLATKLDPRLATSIGRPTQPPTFEAYREFSEGLDYYTRTSFPAAADRFTRAYQRDTTFAVALLMASISIANLGRYAKADSLLNILSRARGQLSPYYRDWLDYRRSLLGGDRLTALRAVRLLAAAVPGTKATFNWGSEALQNGNLHEAKRAFESLAPDRGAMRGWAPYWDGLGSVEHLLALYTDELETGKRARVAYPDRPYVLGSSVRALAALGRTMDLGKVLDAADGMPADPYGATPGTLAYDAGVELRAHGHPEEARQFLRRGLAWYDARGSPSSLALEDRFRRAQILYQLGRWEEARGGAASLTGLDSTDAEYLGLLGAAAARLGDSAAGQRASALLARLPRRYGLGVPTVAEARIAAIRGQRDSAVALLKRAFGEGLEFDLWIHRDVDLEGLHGYRPFEDLVRVKDR